jgi:hypothetical protein
MSRIIHLKVKGIIAIGDALELARLYPLEYQKYLEEITRIALEKSTEVKERKIK